MRSFLLSSVRAHAGRLFASALAIVLAVAFVVATLVLSGTARSTVLEAAAARYVGTDAVVTSRDGTPVPVDLVRSVASVRAVAPESEAIVQAAVPGARSPQHLRLEAVADDGALRWQRLSAGQLPTADGQVAVSDRSGAAIGDALTITTYDPAGSAARWQVEVVGLVDLGSATDSLTGRVFATAGQAQRWDPAPPTEVRVVGSDQVLAELADALAARPLDVRSGSAQAELLARELTGGQVELTAALLVFAAVAVLVAGLVIANTFAVLLAQRTRELALLRCVGGTSRQVRRGLLGEALLVGLVGSALGALAGTGLAAGVAAAVGADSPVPLSGTVVPPSAVVIGFVVGTGVTVLAAVAPARAATRVAPLAALRPVDPSSVRSRPGVLRLLAGAGLLLAGVALLAVGVDRGDLRTAVVGGAASFLGVVLLAQRVVPPAVALAGRWLTRVGGLPVELAAGGATRNPRRTAATATALLIGVTLTTAMVVGAASTRATARAEITSEYPTDVVVQTFGDPLPGGLLGQLAGIDGVAAGATVTQAELTGPDGQPLFVEGLDPAEAGAVLRDTRDLPGDGDVVLSPLVLADWGVEPGERVELRSGAARVSLTARPGEVTAARVPSRQLAALGAETTAGQLWLRLSAPDRAAQAATVDRISEVTATEVPQADVSGLVTVRAQLDDVLDTLLLVVLGLLAVAVVIALLGVGNTLALSVVERRQEHGLLRALGLTRAQLRAVLAWEAILVAGVAAGLGALLGGAYGVAGVAAVLGRQAQLVLDVPWLQVTAIVVVAVVAGAVASVLPARRAARTSPVAAIAS